MMTTIRSGLNYGRLTEESLIEVTSLDYSNASIRKGQITSLWVE